MLNYAQKRPMSRSRTTVMTLGAMVALIVGLSGCSGSAEEEKLDFQKLFTGEESNSSVEEAASESTSTPVPKLEDVTYSEFASGYVELSDGRIVMCVSLRNSSESPITCDWGHAVDKIVLSDDSDKTKIKKTEQK